MVLVGNYVYGGHGGNNTGFPYCLDLEKGKLAWGPLRADGGAISVLYADGLLYFRYQKGTMALVEPTPAGFRVKSSFIPPDNSGGNQPGWAYPVIAGGRLYIRGNDIMLCYDVSAKN